MYEFRQLFSTVCNMSITSIFIILFVILIRQFLRESYKSFSYYLWGVVGFRLLCPITFSSQFSLFNIPFLKDMAVSGDTMEWKGVPDYKTSKSFIWKGRQLTGAKNVVKTEKVGGDWTEVIYEPDPLLSLDIIEVFAFLWLTVILLLIGYQLYSYFKLKKTLEMSIILEDNVYECDRITEPFVLGFFRPKIYLPFHLSQGEKRYILQHEKYHIKRHDHQIKILAFVLLAIHWFNPFVWLAYYLMCKDMEMSCDEQVLIQLGNEIKKDYSNSLLHFAMQKRTWGLGTLAFGEISITERVKNILNFKKPKKSLMVFSVVLCLFAVYIAIANGQLGNVIRNVSDQKGAFAEYEYHLSDKVKSFVVYKEYYQYGELLEYEVLASGEFGEHACDREGKVKLSQGIEESDETGLWCATLDYEIDGVTTTVKNKAGEYGYAGVAPRFFLENTGNWQKINLEQDFVFAAFHMDDGEGVTSYSCEHFQNKKIRQVYLRGHAGVILFHIVFSEKDVDALKEEYLMPSNVKELFAAKNLYIGNHVADGKLIGMLNLPVWGDCTMELQTSQEPYGIIMHYEKEPENKEEFEKAIWQDAAIFLALTENAGFFEWTYPRKDGLLVEQTRYYVEDIEQMLKIEDLKAYAESEETLLELMTLVENSEW